MPVVSVTSDPAALTVTVIGEYPVTPERLWAAWANPHQLERFWGPPQWPATFTRHDMVEGGRSAYAMTGPHGEAAHGWWRFERLDAPRAFEVVDGFANPDGTPNDALPQSRFALRIEPTATGARFVGVSTYASVEAMETVLAMGMLEGISTALSQLDDMLADLREHAAALLAALEVLDDTHVQITREVRGTLHQVWRCHHEAHLLQRWLLGPDGWTMPVCQVATQVGDSYRYEWSLATPGEAEQRFGFTGELLESQAPWRAVTTERLAGTDGPSTVNELVLTPRPGGRTRITLRIAYPTRELRDMVLSTGMIEGMEASYGRLEAVAAA